VESINTTLSLDRQIELHESLVLTSENLVIDNPLPASIDKQLCGKMISISFCRDYNKTFTKKQFPGGVYMFDIGKIISVLPSGSKHNDDGDGMLKVKYVEDNSTLTVSLHLSNYASESITMPTKEHQWRLLSSQKN